MDMEVMAREAEEVFSACVGELQTAGQLPAGSVVVLGCSTSEVAGAKIGKGSVPELGAVIARAMIAACAKHGLRAAFQCCEHLNRAVVMEHEVLKEYGCVQVRAIPQPKAGGSVPAAAWKQLREPVLAQAIQADAAIDVGERCLCAEHTDVSAARISFRPTPVSPTWAAHALYTRNNMKFARGGNPL